MLLWPQHEQMKLHNTTSTIQSLTLITVWEHLVKFEKATQGQRNAYTYACTPPPTTTPQATNSKTHSGVTTAGEIPSNVACGCTQTLPQENHQLLLYFCKPWEHIVLNTSLTLLLPLMSYSVSPSMLSSSEGKSKTNEHCGQRIRNSKRNKHCGQTTRKSKTNKHCGQSQTPGNNHHHYNKKWPKTTTSNKIST